MFKFATTLTLSLTVFAAVASSAQLTSPPATTKNNIRVIVQNEAIAPGLCRLHFENAETKDVACK